MAVGVHQRSTRAVYFRSILFVAFVSVFLLLPLWRKKGLWVQHRYETHCEQESTATTTTVVIGAGVIGLCTAYHLAKNADHRTAEKRHRVIVVEDAGQVFPATSSTNTGILSHTGFVKDVLGLAQYSYELWEALGRGNIEFNRQCGYKERMNIALKPGSGEGLDLIPDWIQTELGWNAAQDPQHGKMAIINPVALGDWLYNECLNYGVEFRMNTRVVSADISTTYGRPSLKIVGDDQTPSELEYDKLVLAAGPWTPTLFNTLFPNSSVNMEPVISAGEWFVFENPEPASNRWVSAVYLDELVDEKLEFAGRNDHTVWTTGEEGHVGEVPAVGDVPQPNVDSLAKLKAYADAFLKRPQNGTQGLRVLSQGRSYRPATRTGLPVIGGVPACKLSKDHDHNFNTSVYINAGHGSYGVTLGMGSGKIMSQLILNESVDLNVSRMQP